MAVFGQKVGNPATEEPGPSGQQHSHMRSFCLRNVSCSRCDSISDIGTRTGSKSMPRIHTMPGVAGLSFCGIYRRCLAARELHEDVGHVHPELREEEMRGEEAPDVDLGRIGDALAVVGEVDAEQRVRFRVDREHCRHRDLVNLRICDGDGRSGRAGDA